MILNEWDSDQKQKELLEIVQKDGVGLPNNLVLEHTTRYSIEKRFPVARFRFFSTEAEEGCSPLYVFVVVDNNKHNKELIYIYARPPTREHDRSLLDNAIAELMKNFHDYLEDHGEIRFRSDTFTRDVLCDMDAFRLSYLATTAVFYLTVDQMAYFKNPTLDSIADFHADSVDVEKDAAKIHANWEQRCESVEATKDYLRYLPSTVIRDSSTGEAVSWNTTAPFGQAINQFTVPKFRRQGLARLTQMHYGVTLVSEGLRPFKYVQIRNSIVLEAAKRNQFSSMWEEKIENNNENDRNMKERERRYFPIQNTIIKKKSEHLIIRAIDWALFTWRTLSLFMSTFISQVFKENIVEDMFLTADLDEMEQLENDLKGKRPPLKIVWRNVVIFSILHIGALFGFYQFLFVAKWLTCLWACLLSVGGNMGITAGAHRMWSHRSFKAVLPVRVYFMLWSTVSFQNDVIEWARDHRCHHKWTDTEADPHNSRRGFWYAHIGWLCTRKSDKLKEMGAKLNLSDLFADPVLVFQRKYYYPLVALLCFILPTAVPVFWWNESAVVAFFVAAIFRYVFALNTTWLINSAAHMFGYKPYDASVSSVESRWSDVQCLGEGGHNFHHAFPQDYRVSEFSLATNWTRAVIDAFAFFGLIYDRKTVSDAAIQSFKQKKGDKTEYWHH